LGRLLVSIFGTIVAYVLLIAFVWWVVHRETRIEKRILENAHKESIQEQESKPEAKIIEIEPEEDYSGESLFRLHDQGKSYRELSRESGLSLGTVKSRISRHKQLLNS